MRGVYQFYVKHSSLSTVDIFNSIHIRNTYTFPFSPTSISAPHQRHQWRVRAHRHGFSAYPSRTSWFVSSSSSIPVVDTIRTLYPLFNPLGVVFLPRRDLLNFIVSCVLGYMQVISIGVWSHEAEVVKMNSRCGSRRFEFRGT